MSLTSEVDNYHFGDRLKLVCMDNKDVISQHATDEERLEYDNYIKTRPKVDAASTSNKNKTAKSLGVPILTEEEFMERYL